MTTPISRERTGELREMLCRWWNEYYCSDGDFPSERAEACKADLLAILDAYPALVEENERLRGENERWCKESHQQQARAEKAEAELELARPLIEAAIALGNDCVLSNGDDSRLKRLRYAALAFK